MDDFFSLFLFAALLWCWGRTINLKMNLTPSLNFLLPVQFCAKEITAPLFMSSELLAEQRDALGSKSIFALSISFFSPEPKKSQGRISGLCLNLAPADVSECLCKKVCMCVCMQVLSSYCPVFWLTAIWFYGYLCHCKDFIPNYDIFIKYVTKYIKIGGWNYYQRLLGKYKLG